MKVDESEVARRLAVLAPAAARLDERLAAAGAVDVTVIAVTKGHPVEVAIAAAAHGFTDLGENYAQELLDKYDVVGDRGHRDLRWHFIGRLQTNKVRGLAGKVSLWQSVDRAKLGREIAKRDPGASVLVQVNLSGEPQKGGCPFEDLDRVVDELGELGLHVRGLMGVGTEGDLTRTATEFRRLRSEVDRLGLEHCSMGMSADLEVAIAEGSTMVRIGSDLFGPRP